MPKYLDNLMLECLGRNVLVPKRLGIETSRAETARYRNVWGRNIFVLKHLVAETSVGRNVVCRLATLLF